MGELGRIAGEQALQEVLEANGVKILQPERRTLGEQIAAVRRHRTIIGFRGAAFQTLLFSESPKTVVRFWDSFPSPQWLLTDAFVGAHGWHVLGATHGDFPLAAGIRNPLIADLKPILDLLRDLGIVRGPIRNLPSAAERLEEYKIYCCGGVAPHILVSGGPLTKIAAVQAHIEGDALSVRRPAGGSGSCAYPGSQLYRIRTVTVAHPDLIPPGATRSESNLIAGRGKNGVKCDEVRRHALHKIGDIEEKIQTLRAMKHALRGLVQECASTSATLSDCPILESLDSNGKR